MKSFVCYCRSCSLLSNNKLYHLIQFLSQEARSHLSCVILTQGPSPRLGLQGISGSMELKDTSVSTTRLSNCQPCDPKLWSMGVGTYWFTHCGFTFWLFSPRQEILRFGSNGFLVWGLKDLRFTKPNCNFAWWKSTLVSIGKWLAGKPGFSQEIIHMHAL